MGVGITTNRFDAGTVTLAAHTWGDSDPEGEARPLLLCHCTGFHGIVWQPIAERLVDAGFSVWSFDFRGHGDSDVPDSEYRWEPFGDDVLAVVDHLGLGGRDDLVGIGHSKGAAALVLAESKRPGTFERLWLYEPVIFPGDPAPGPTRGNVLAQSARRRREVFASPADAHANFAAKPPMDAFVAEALQAYVDHGLRRREDGQWELKCPGEIEARMYEMGSAHEGYRRLAELQCPTVVVAGQVTDAMPPGYVQPLAERVPNGRFELAEGLSHFGPMEDPDAVVASILRSISG